MFYDEGEETGFLLAISFHEFIQVFPNLLVIVEGIL